MNYPRSHMKRHETSLDFLRAVSCGFVDHSLFLSQYCNLQFRDHMKSAFINRASVLYDAALALLYPQSCAACGVSVETRSDGVTCGACWEKTLLISAEDLICWKCGAPAPGRVPEEKRREV